MSGKVFSMNAQGINYRSAAAAGIVIAVVASYLAFDYRSKWKDAQREVTELPLPAGARFRCSACGNRDPHLIKVWHTGGSSSARIVSFPRGKRGFRTGA